jgi:DNA recombination protein Rad52
MDPPTGFTNRQLALLAAPLNRANVKSRKQGSAQVSYIPGWHAINEANKIFGYDCWQRETIALECVNASERTIGRDNKSGWTVTYTARVRITVFTGISFPNIIREGCGAGHGIDVDLGQAHESALKEAETDAMKRALMTFGNPFGLALYDKEQSMVANPPSPLLADALACCRRDGLTDLGIAALAMQLSDGQSETLEGAPAEILNRIINQGISPATRDRCNGDISGTLGAPVWLSGTEPDPNPPH